MTTPTERYCPLCTDEGPCAFHAAKNPEELAGAAVQSVREHGSVGLAIFIASALAKLETALPDLVSTAASKLSLKPLVEDFADLLDQDDFTTDDLRQLAAISITMALVQEHQDQQKEGTDHGPRTHHSKNREERRRRKSR